MEKLERYLIKNKISYQKDISLATFTTTKVGGKAKYLIEVKREDEVIFLIKLFKRLKVSYFVIGEGSNVLISDEQFDGACILNRLTDYQINNSFVQVKSGTKLTDLILKTAEKGLSGMEKLVGIPGTIGGAIYGNAGAYGQAVSDNLVRVKIFDGQKIRWLDKKNCQFTYRESIFKETKPFILGAEFKLTKSDRQKVQKNIGRSMNDRLKKYKKGICCPGSFFKNIEVKKVPVEILRRIPKDKIVYGKIPAGYLLESICAKDIQVGKIKVLEKHANFLINTGGGRARDYYNLAMILKDKVKQKFGIELEPEVQIFGFKETFKGKKVAVLGLGMEGRDLVKYLLKEKALLTIYDMKVRKDLDLSGIPSKKVKFILGENYLKKGLKDYDVVFRSPGVYRYLPQIVKAEKYGVKISSASKLFFEKCPAKIIGVTGTKGKGTTSTLIYQILKQLDKKVFLAGNIGRPFLELLPDLNKDSWVILELSSFQLIDFDKSPHIAIVLNITEDHLDWHKDKKEYVQAKTNIVTHQVVEDFAVINQDYIIPRNFDRLTKGRVYYFSRKKEVKGSYIENGKIYLALNNRWELVGKTRQLLLKGEHNLENVTAAICTSVLAGARVNNIKKVIFNFKGLEHRLKLVCKINGISFYNDSYATGPQPTIAAIKSFSEPLTLILGGYDKKLNYSLLLAEIKRAKNIKNIILIGDLERKLNLLISKGGYQGKIIRLRKVSMKKIVEVAFKETPKNGTVLLSPAAASFDMFKNYKDRGNQFKKAVRALK